MDCLPHANEYSNRYTYVISFNHHNNPGSQDRKLRQREVKKLAQGCRSDEGKPGREDSVIPGPNI